MDKGCSELKSLDVLINLDSRLNFFFFFFVELTEQTLNKNKRLTKTKKLE